MINGDAKSRAQWIAYALGTIGLSVVGTKGLGAVSKTGMATTKAAAKAGVGTVKGTLKETSIPNLFPYAPQHQLAGANMGVVPFNTVDSVGLRDRLLSMAKVESKGRGKGAKSTEKAKIFGKYSTAIDDKVKVIEKVDLPDWISESFTDSNYRTVITEENITFYRTYGGGAKASGSFVTTTPAGNRINAKISTALVPDWKNTRQYEAVIEIPKGQVLNIGRVEKQYTKTGALLEGDWDQILLPQGWPSEWIKETREVPSR